MAMMHAQSALVSPHSLTGSLTAVRPSLQHPDQLCVVLCCSASAEWRATIGPRGCLIEARINATAKAIGGPPQLCVPQQRTVVLSVVSVHSIAPRLASLPADTHLNGC